MRSILNINTKYCMTIQQNISLLSFNTFGIDAYAEQYAEVSNINELSEILSKQKPDFILGGGSNVLFTKDVQGLVVKNNFTGKEVIQEDENEVHVKFGAGENWHECVLWAVERDYGGIENLSLIPGTIGAAPIQNIGAYGVELKQVFVSLEAVHMQEKSIRTFVNRECLFGYRSSIFKNEFKDQYFITSVTLKLTKNNHQLNTSYGTIEKTLENTGIDTPSIRSISDAVISIRSSKLPDPAKIGNAGSFFKNPVLLKSQFEVLQAKHPDMFCYDMPNNYAKIPAGWLIEQCGWKGKRIGNAGTHINQALVLVNHGGAAGEDILRVAYEIQDAVHSKYQILLKPEVNIL